MKPEWPGAGLVRAELEYMPPRVAFAAEHPGTKWSRVGRVFTGHVPYIKDGQERSITVKGDSWPAVLRALKAYFSDDGEQDTG